MKTNQKHPPLYTPQQLRHAILSGEIHYGVPVNGWVLESVKPISNRRYLYILRHQTESFQAEQQVVLDHP